MVDHGISVMAMVINIMVVAEASSSYLEVSFSSESLRSMLKWSQCELLMFVGQYRGRCAGLEKSQVPSAHHGALVWRPTDVVQYLFTHINSSNLILSAQ